MSTTPIDAELLAQQAEKLSDDIEALDNTRAPLWAVYGYNGTWQDERKAILCACANLIRASHNGAKITEAQIDQEAHTHQTYTDILELAEKSRTNMALLDAEIASKQRRYELAKERMANFRKAAI
jgi:hypothetical protein